MCCCRCAQQAIPHLSEMQRVWVYVMVVNARVRVPGDVFPVVWQRDLDRKHDPG